MLHAIDSIKATNRLATSALPGAPVIEPDPEPTGRTRSVVAALLRRAADRLAREPAGLPAQ